MRNHFEHPTTLYLASRSPRRVELLKQIGLACITHPADIDESQANGETPQAYVLRLAREKAQACLSMLSAAQAKHAILAADTTVELDGKVLGKPENDNDARTMLAGLAGSVHQVHTAVALAYMNKIEVVLSTTTVEMMAVSQAQIAHYIASGEHRDKAGSYGIQGMAGAWIKRIDGSYTGVMGLPIYETAELLRKHHIIQI
ncbi:MAG: septum formation inhibitor Maf [Methylotenera sp. 24-45-7]|jgi:septum formation protein|nr:MAG: septum formation inhibitor Maf [Mehylophilales bacterium 35-46-6]OYZ41252.1 MAG: septum formation inhibitor Maf [Methylotenera sp. 24-45-7]OZA09297.1 MAG: septum formation inhibitor Maf [Methylotenera sp. 17-45-7]OZA53919.1 MAG: septum formation inhibitor Maf [Methylophilales bacterium 39-45-7]HQS36710.1 Maf family protein [Methylotenera sp.]